LTPAAPSISAAAMPRPSKMPPRGNNRDRRHGVDDLRHQCHRADFATITTRLATLRYDHVDASFGCLDGLRDRGDLQHHLRADSVSLPHQVAGIAEREGDDPRPCLQGVTKRFCIQALWDVVDRKRSIGERLYHIDVAFDGCGGPEQRSDAAQPSFVGYGSREFRRCARPHRRQDDRHVEAQKFAKACFQHRKSLDPEDERVMSLVSALHASTWIGLKWVRAGRRCIPASRRASPATPAAAAPTAASIPAAGYADEKNRKPNWRSPEPGQLEPIARCGAAYF